MGRSLALICFADLCKAIFFFSGLIHLFIYFLGGRVGRGGFGGNWKLPPPLRVRLTSNKNGRGEESSSGKKSLSFSLYLSLSLSPGDCLISRNNLVLWLSRHFRNVRERKRERETEIGTREAGM